MCKRYFFIARMSGEVDLPLIHLGKLARSTLRAGKGAPASYCESVAKATYIKRSSR
jgi:hypothetical protein